MFANSLPLASYASLDIRCATIPRCIWKGLGFFFLINSFTCTAAEGIPTRTIDDLTFIFLQVVSGHLQVFDVLITIFALQFSS